MTVLFCRNCGQDKQPVPADGDYSAEIMWIGESPGFREVESGKPFVGPAGKVFSRILVKLDIPRSSCYVTNVVKCRFTEDGRNRTPTPQEVDKCMPWLRAELAFSAARLVITLGETASRAVAFPKKDIAVVRGRLRTDGKRLFGATYHPAAVLRDPEMEDVIVEDVRNFVEVLRGWKL
ncbi:MAG: uracil-DNA glycosylase [Methanomicrobiales archaeon]|nr:uracil-DNA glycosylase [Methanomicrobiales archaeon]